MPKLPNILITGTPGTGKTTTASKISSLSSLQHIQISDLVKEKQLHHGIDEKFDSYTLNEDALLDLLEPEIEEGGKIIDFHSCDFFPEHWFDLVIVLRTNNTILYDRLKQRQYSEIKIQENVCCEIMNVLEEEALSSYPKEMVVCLQSESKQDLEENVQRIQQWIKQWQQDQNSDTDSD